jgi:hypothetical protein
MTEKERLLILLDEVKHKIQMLDEIEKRLLKLKDIALRSLEKEVLESQRIDFQKEVDELLSEISLLEKNETIFN